MRPINDETIQAIAHILREATGETVLGTVVVFTPDGATAAMKAISDEAPAGEAVACQILCLGGPHDAIKEVSRWLLTPPVEGEEMIEVTPPIEGTLRGGH